MGEANDLTRMQVGPISQKRLVEVPEARHGAKSLVLLRTDDLKERFRARKDRVKEILTESENDVSLKESLEPEIAMLAICFPQLFRGQVRISWLKPAQSLRCHVQ